MRKGASSAPRICWYSSNGSIRPRDAGLVDRGHAVLVEVGDQLVEPALDALRADDVRGDLAHHDVEEPGLPEVARIEVDLVARRPATGDRLGGDVER